MRILIFFLLLIMYQQSIAQQSLTQYQYWFDDNYTMVQQGIMSGNEFNSNIPAATLSYGPHTLHIRFMQSNGKWGSVHRQAFIKKAILEQVEYWFDENYSNRTTTNVPVSDQLNYSTLIDVTGLSYGPHWLHARFKTQEGKWSSTITQTFVRNPLIDQYEYWFNDQFNQRTTQTLSNLQSSLNVNDLLNCISLNGREHTIHFRAHKTDGLWSSPLSHAFQKRNHINGFEYWFNDQYTNKIIQTIAAIESFDLNPLIDVSSSPLGSNQLNLRFRDENGLWSPVITEGFCHNEGDSSIHLKILLQGYYSGNGMMHPVLLNQGVSNDPLLVDSIDVELHETTSPYALAGSDRAPLSTSGEVSVNFPTTPSGNYYVAVKHRNTLQTWSSFPIFKGDCPTEYDFTTHAYKAFGNNMIQVDTLWAFYTGDLNQDENTDLLDVSLVETDINAFQFGYFASDINGDGNVDLLDSPVLEGNVNNFVFAVHP